MEIWKDIVGYEGLYQVSNMGRVKSLDRWVKAKGNTKKLNKEKIMSVCSKNYNRIILTKDKKEKCHKVCRLVAAAFIPNPFNKATVNHIDGNKLNDCVDNLEWATHSENLKHAFATGLKFPSNQFM
jgi:hypothetical protein